MSTGGQVVIEIAYQILASGEEVHFVGLFDTSREAYWQEVPPENLPLIKENPNKFTGKIEAPHNEFQELISNYDARVNYALEYFGIEFDHLPFLLFVEDPTSVPWFDDEISVRMINSPELDSIFDLICKERMWPKH